MKSALAIVFSFFLFVFSLIFATPAFAQTANQYPNPNSQFSNSGQAVNPNIAANTNPDVPKNLHNWTQSVLLEVSSAMTCQLVGIDPSDPHAKCLGYDQKSGKIGYVENGGGLGGVLIAMMVQMSDIPVHTSDFTGYLADNFGVEKKTLAVSQDLIDTNRQTAQPTPPPIPNPCNSPTNQTLGVGYCGLRPLLPIWEVFRNIVYLIFVLIFMIIGIAIMLRVHIDPRTVMTIENQIPKLVVGLILVTFSYAIAGFMIDGMYVAIYLVYAVMSSIPHSSLTSLSPQVLQGVNAIGLGNQLGSGLGAGPHDYIGFVSVMAGNLSSLIKSLIGLHNFDVLQNGTPIGAVSDIAGLIQNSFGGGGASVSFFDAMVNIGTLLTSLQVATNVALPASVGGCFVFCFDVDAKLPTFVAAFFGVYAVLQLFIRDVVPYAIPFLIILIATIWALFRLWFVLIQAYIFILLDVASAPFWLLLGLVPGSKLGFSAWFRDILANIVVFPVTITMFLAGRVFIDAFGTSDTTGQFVPPLLGATVGTNIIGAIIAIGIILSTPDILRMTREFFKAPELNLKAVGAAVGVGGGALNVPGHLMKYGQFRYYLSQTGTHGNPLSFFRRRQAPPASTEKGPGGSGNGGQPADSSST